MMSGRSDFGALERLLRPLSRKLSKELSRALVEVQPDEEAQKRYELLADKNTEGTISPEERIELESLVRANTLLQILKLEAHAMLADSQAA